MKLMLLTPHRRARCGFRLARGFGYSRGHGSDQHSARNAQVPKAPALSEADRAETEAFLDEVLRILPLVGVFAFETSSETIKPAKIPQSPKSPAEDEIDTVIVPAHEEGFEKGFQGQNCWYEIRIAAEKLDKIKYIAVYRTAPVSAITHFAPVHHIEP
ncbi:MAG: hypothetical protein HYX28_00600 [Candidatus Koribacter versatilis]|uniref:Uncharacterized protein n=1 Tax=Candidatus Korobacter versatilis TaxID=658062 RepID=A0A932A835_9BACT|nr:hypothetical protein [Candidatus Koribacter versatilis]